MIWLFSPSVKFGIMKVLGLAKRAESALTPRGARHGYVAQLVGLDITDNTSELQLTVIFTVGCDKVNCLLGQEKVLLGDNNVAQLVCAMAADSICGFKAIPLLILNLLYFPRFSSRYF